MHLMGCSVCFFRCLLWSGTYIHKKYPKKQTVQPTNYAYLAYKWKTNYCLKSCELFKSEIHTHTHIFFNTNKCYIIASFYYFFTNVKKTKIIADMLNKLKEMYIHKESDLWIKFEFFVHIKWYSAQKLKLQCIKHTQTYSNALFIILLNSVDSVRLV